MRGLLIVFAAVCLAACDDGHVDEKMLVDDGEGYNVVLAGRLTGLDSWQGDCSVVLAGFDGESDYSVIQKTVVADSSGRVEMRLANVSTAARSIELAAVNNLRARLVTFFSCPIGELQDVADTIRLDVGEMDVSMYAAINRGVFNDSFFSCARCHSSSSAAAHLDLTEANSYDNLVNVSAFTDGESVRVVPGNADSSLLYRVITDGAGIGYSHPSLFADEHHSRLVSLVKQWIESVF